MNQMWVKCQWVKLERYFSSLSVIYSLLQFLLFLKENVWMVMLVFNRFRFWCVENITRRFREQFIHATLKHDVSYIESMKPGRIGQILSEESSRIINGLGPSIGQLVRALATFLSGCIIGFVYVLYFVYSIIVELATYSCYFILCSFCYNGWILLFESNGTMDWDFDERS